MVILSPVRFIGVLKSQGRTIRIQVSWEPEKSISVVATVGILVDDALYDI